MLGIRASRERRIARFPGSKSPPRHSLSDEGSGPLPLRVGQGGQASMQVRPVTGRPRKRHFAVRRILLAILRWTFIVIGAVTASSVLFSYLFHVNKSIYDPQLFAIGICGLFCLQCGVMLMVMARNSRLRLELRLAKIRCEELADSAWELKEAEARATSLLEAQGDLIVRRDSGGRITYANDAYCALTGTSRDALLGTTTAPPSLEQGRASTLPAGTGLHDEQIMTADGPRLLAGRAAGGHDLLVMQPGAVRQ